MSWEAGFAKATETAKAPVVEVFDSAPELFAAGDGTTEGETRLVAEPGSVPGGEWEWFSLQETGGTWLPRWIDFRRFSSDAPLGEPTLIGSPIASFDGTYGHKMTDAGDDFGVSWDLASRPNISCKDLRSLSFTIQTRWTKRAGAGRFAHGARVGIPNTEDPNQPSLWVAHYDYDNRLYRDFSGFSGISSNPVAALVLSQLTINVIRYSLSAVDMSACGGLAMNNLSIGWSSVDMEDTDTLAMRFAHFTKRYLSGTVGATDSYLTRCSFNWIKT